MIGRSGICSRKWKRDLVTFLIVIGASRLPVSEAATWYVDGARACSNSGPGSEVSPLCTIGAGAQRAVAGDTVRVAPALYREQVTLAASGTAAFPIVFEATGPGAVVMGSVDVTDPAAWSQTSTTVWSRPLAPPPRQIWVDGVRLKTATGISTTTSGSYFYDAAASRLYVDIGGGSPGVGHTVEAGTRSYGFSVVVRDHLVIQGFQTRYQSSAGIRVSGAVGIVVRGVEVSSSVGNGIRIESSNGPVLVDNAEVMRCGSTGIALSGARNVTLRNNVSHHNENHGIGLQSSGENLIDGNVCYSNVRPDVRSAVGIDVNGGSSTNTVRWNTVFSNQDSGINVYNASNDVLVVRNISYDNGDHGFDTVGSIGTRYISNTSFRNTNDGFSVEGGSTSTSLFNNISVDNGLSSAHFDLFVDPIARPGLTSDWNIFWNSNGSASVKVNGVVYSSLFSYRAATGQEIHGVGEDPRFRNAGARDLHPGVGSPALDSANTDVSGFVLDDRYGMPPSDDPSIADSGAGAPTFVDRGALERQVTAGEDQPPIAQISVTPSSGPIDLRVTADASASTDVDDTPIASYTFDFGNGAIVGPQAHPAATYTYRVVGNYSVLVTVTDTAGNASSYGAMVTVRDDPPVAVLQATPASVPASAIVTLDATGSTDGDATPIASYTFDFKDGTIVGPQPSPVAAHVYAGPGTYKTEVIVRDTAGNSARATATVKVRRY